MTSLSSSSSICSPDEFVETVLGCKGVGKLSAVVLSHSSKASRRERCSSAATWTSGSDRSVDKNIIIIMHDGSVLGIKAASLQDDVGGNFIALPDEKRQVDINMTPTMDFCTVQCGSFLKKIEHFCRFVAFFNSCKY